MPFFPNHPDIQSALDTGYPRSYWQSLSSDEEGPDPDEAYEERRAQRDEQE